MDRSQDGGGQVRFGQILTRRGRSDDPASDQDLRVRLRAEGHRDVLLVVSGGVAGLEPTDDGGDEPYLELDAAARTLFIWVDVRTSGAARKVTCRRDAGQDAGPAGRLPTPAGGGADGRPRRRRRR